MSIAVSTVVKPSCMLLLATLSMCAGCAAIGIFIGVRGTIDLPYLARLLLAAGCLLASLLGIVMIFRGRMVRHLDISGIGQIRLTEEPSRVVSGSISKATSGSPPIIFQLLSTSTLWSHLLILNLRADNGTTRTLVILPDTMPRTSFRALAVACHWIAAHNNRAESEKT